MLFTLLSQAPLSVSQRMIEQIMSFMDTNNVSIYIRHGPSAVESALHVIIRGLQCIVCSRGFYGSRVGGCIAILVQQTILLLLFANHLFCLNKMLW